jgi:hypothetical protein
LFFRHNFYWLIYDVSPFERTATKEST